MTAPRTDLRPGAGSDLDQAVASILEPAGQQTQNPMKILMAASEVEPYSKTGGLADVLGALPRALAALGHDVGVVAPLYRSTRALGLDVVFESLTIPMGPNTYFPRVYCSVHQGVKIYFVDYAPFYDRDGYYGTAAGDYADNAQRFMLLSRAALEIAKLDFRPHVLHCHDWQTAMAPLLLRTLYAGDPAFASTRTVFTIHNLGYQGAFPPSVLADIGLPVSLFTIDGLEFFGNVSYLKAGLVFADRLTTVSEAYAREIQTPEYGHGVDGLLRLRSSDIVGVLNGVDYSQWDPQTDSLIVQPYGPAKMDGKRACKKDLLETFGLDPSNLDRPVIGMVSRLAAQKGFDLVAAAADRLMQLDLALVILGKGEPGFERLLTDLQKLYPDKLGLRLAYDNVIAHKIEAGADMLLMPSRYEPSGLNQMYSLRYGTVPIVRATGGLDDSIQPFDPATQQGNGFKFTAYASEAMMKAIEAALAARQNRALWAVIRRNGMLQDYSWKRSAAKYVALYEELIAAAPPALPVTGPWIW
jgi:starch synthase